MPRAEGIAWKFVIKQGKKWRCPYCKKEYSGSVTRVKSHFCKQPKEGIVSCTKVPQHISMLMELLQNQVDNKDDIAWKFVDRLGENIWHCHHCKEEFLGDLAGVKGHLLGVPTERIPICTEVPDHIITLMRSLLDEVAEEESRGANGQSFTEPQSHDMPAQAEVGEEESRGTSHQFSTEPQSLGMLPPAIFSPSQVFEYTEHSFTTREETDLANLASDQQQAERQSHRSLTMPIHSSGREEKHLLYSSEQNMCFLTEVVTLAATIQTCESQQPSSHWQTGHDLDILQQSNQSQQSCDAESDDLLRQQLSMDECALLSLKSNHPPQLFDQSVQGNGQQHLSASSSLPDEVAEEQSREAHRQSSMEPQSCDTPTQPSPVLTPENLEYVRTLLSTPRGASHMANFTPQGVIGLNSDQQSQVEHQLRQSSAMPLFVQSSHVQPALVSPQHQSVLCQSINHEIRDTQQNGTIPLDNLDTTRQPDLHDSPPENLVESRDVIVNALEETQTNGQHNPTVGSSLHNDLSLDVDHTNRLLDWSQAWAVEGVPSFSNTSPTNAVEHPDQLHPRCDWEGGNDTCFVPSPTPLDVNCFFALPHSSDSRDNLQVVEAATDAMGPSSSQDMNRCSPTMNLRSIYANDEMIRNLKRKVEELDNKEAVIKEQMEIESAASSVRKKPRILVERWLKETERARNNFQIIGQANAETLSPKEQVETLTIEVEELMESLEADSFMESLEANSFMESLDADSLNCELLDNIFQNELQGSLLPDPFASDTQLSNMATTNTPQQSSQPLQIDTEWGHGTGRQPPIPSLPSTGPLTAESVDPLQIPEGVTNPIGPWTSEGEGTSSSMMALAEEARSPFNLLWQPQCSIQSQMPKNYQQIPAGVSSFQYNQLTATGNSHCLQDSNQHSQLQTPMDIDPSIASRHTSDPHIIEATINDSQVPKAATNTTGPSSSQDMNRCSPTMNLRSIYANDEMIRNLKRKVEELDNKEAVINEQMEMESAASSVRKKPRILVERWLKETERARNNFQIIGQANAETLSPKEQVETLTREVEELMGKTLPQTLLIEERDAKGVKKLTGEAIHRNIELIWDLLTKNHGCKLGIYGMGGVGKTAIMMHIRNRLLDDATFDGVVFITVSKDFSIYKLQSDIGKALKCGSMEDEDEKKRAAMLSEHLERKKNCVLILDDVWEHLDLEEVGIPIRAHGFKFVLTTRSFDVCCQMQCQEKIKIEPLSQEEAESLFLEEIGPEMPLSLENEALVKSIVKECAGLPIGVITMARSIRGVADAYKRRDFLMKLKESSMGQTNTEMKLLMNLKVSYDPLNPDVQHCFLCCPSSLQPPISLPKLEGLTLDNLPQLKSCDIPIRCDSLKNLTVSQCPKLKRILCPCDCEKDRIWSE